MHTMKPKSVLLMLQPISLPRLEGIARYAREHCWNLVLEDRLFGNVRDWNGDGVLTTLRDRADQKRAIRAFVRRGIPVVDLTVACPDVKVPRVVSDHAEIGRLAARHFRERGFDRLAWFSSGWSNVHRLRYDAYAAESGQCPDKWNLRNIRRKLETCRKPIGVLAFDEAEAARVLNAAFRSGVSVPEEISILGIGNDRFLCESQSVTISSVDQNLVENAYSGAALLDRLMDGGRAPARPKLIPPRGIVPRASTDTLANDDPQVRQTLIFIHSHLNRPFGAAEIAQALDIPRTRLDALFADKVGHSIGQEILRQRILRVKRLLKDPSTPIKRIAALCGFCNSGYLTNVFRRETGLTPKAWRRGH